MHKTSEYDATVEMGLPVTLIDTVQEDDDGNLEIQTWTCSWRPSPWPAHSRRFSW